MGTTASSFLDTLTKLKRFNVFPELPTDYFEADKSITMKETNALKKVNNRFTSPLNGHMKRELVLPSPLDVSLVYLSRQRIESNTSVISLLSESSPFPVESSILCSYRVLLPNDLFFILDGDNLVLVVVM